jgi:hypothetical protein
MNTFFKTNVLRTLISEQLPILTASIVISELFYKFHSFTLECLAFLGTWFVLDRIWQMILIGFKK